jgi:cytochrome c
MKSLIGASLAVATLAVAGWANASPDLAKKDGCTNCHDVSAKKVGPAFTEIAAKYKGKAGAEATLVTKITAAKDHPEVKASPDDVQKLVKWILAM